MVPVNDTKPELIRMFPDYADTVLWIDGPVDYQDTGLSIGLIEELRTWEQLFYDSINRTHSFISRGLSERFARKGIALAKRVCSEIGSQFVIEYGGAALLGHSVHFRCPGTASNTVAAACFESLAEAKRTAAREMREVLKDGPGYAVAPQSGAVFDPQGTRTRTASSRKDKR